MDALVSLRKERVERLKVRAGMDGVLQLMEIEVGQLGRSPVDELARVSDPTHLKGGDQDPGKRWSMTWPSGSAPWSIRATG